MGEEEGIAPMPEMNLRHVPPHNEQAERSILSAVLTRPHNLDQVLQSLKPSDFYQRKHQKILTAMTALSLDGTEIDLITVSDKLKSEKSLDEVGGSTYLAELYDEFISDAYIRDHIQIVREKSSLRDLIFAASNIVTKCYEEHENVAEFLGEAEKVILEASQFRKEKTIVSVAEVVPEIYHMMNEIQEKKGKLTGIPSGFADLDRMTNGFQKKDLIVLAARPSMGKSALAVNIAEYCGAKSIPVGIFSLEMATSQLIFRLIASRSKVPSNRIRSGTYVEADYAKISNALGGLSELPIYIDDISAQTALELRAKARVMKRDHAIQLLIIDYLQLMQSGERVENRNLEIGQITRGLKIMAKELDIPILLLSQLNRQLEGRSEKRPTMGDLRDSGQIEADSDIILFLYRESVYGETAENKQQAELIISKQRNGPTGVINLNWNEEITQFTSVTRIGDIEPEGNGAWDND